MTRLVLLCALLLSLGCLTLAQPPITTTNLEPAAPASPPDDKPTKCNARNFPKVPKPGIIPGSPNCCQSGKNIYQVFTTQSGQKGVGHRQLGRACSDDQGKTDCVDKACTFGRCGGGEHWNPLDWD